jgi:hypothetical protein
MLLETVFNRLAKRLKEPDSSVLACHRFLSGEAARRNLSMAQMLRMWCKYTKANGYKFF